MALSELLSNPDLQNLLRNLNSATSVGGSRDAEPSLCDHDESFKVDGLCHADVKVAVNLPCGHEATTTKCYESTNPSLIMCRVRCMGKARGCGHEVRTRCHSRDLLKQALAPLHQCQMLLPCGHRCSSSWCCKNKAYAVAIGKGSTEDHALKQAEAVEHLPCTQMCDKRMPCGHRCERGCHYGRPCKCFGRGCIHAACSAAPCQGDCDWQCPHLAADEEGRQPCTMPCGLPCVRPPCDMQCEKVLPCGHRCPSLCGEPCPEVHNCPKCTGEEGDVIITGEIPLWLPCCGARVQLMELDDVFNMTTYYEQTSERNGYSRLEARRVWSRFGAPKAFPYGHRPHIPECRHCGKPIHLINRYRRITALGSLHGAIEQTLPAHNGCKKLLEDAYASIINIEADVGLFHEPADQSAAAAFAASDAAAGAGKAAAVGKPGDPNPFHYVRPPASWLGGAAGDGVRSKPRPHNEANIRREREVYHPETPALLLLDLTADPMSSMLRVNPGPRDVFTVTSSQLAELRMALRAVYTAYSFADASLQRSVQGSYTSLGGTTDLGIPRFDLTLDIAACQLHLRLCTLLVGAAPELPVDYLLSICDVASKAVTRMTAVMQELYECDSLSAVEEAGLKHDLPHHATSYHALVVCCAARVLKMLMGDPALRAQLEPQLEDIRIEFVQRLEESVMLVAATGSTVDPALLDITKSLRDTFAGYEHELILTVGAAQHLVEGGEGKHRLRGEARQAVVQGLEKRGRPATVPQAGLDLPQHATSYHALLLRELMANPANMQRVEEMARHDPAFTNLSQAPDKQHQVDNGVGQGGTADQACELPMPCGHDCTREPGHTELCVCRQGCNCRFGHLNPATDCNELCAQHCWHLNVANGHVCDRQSEAKCSTCEGRSWGLCGEAHVDCRRCATGQDGDQPEHAGELLLRLGCSHVFTVELLDGLFGMKDYYNESEGGYCPTNAATLYDRFTGKLQVPRRAVLIPYCQSACSLSCACAGTATSWPSPASRRHSGSSRASSASRPTLGRVAM